MKTLTLLLMLPVALLFTEPTDAEIVGSDSQGFLIQVKMPVSAPSQTVYRALTQDISKWWDASHTYSGDAANLYLELEPKGWFGERLPDGGFVRHLEVAYLAPGKSIRLLGGLGPLQQMGVDGALTIQVREAGDSESELLLVYSVHGYSPNGLKALAEPVDQVLTSQMSRLKKHSEEHNGE